MTEQEKYRIAMELVQVAAKLYGTPGWAVAERMNELALELLSKSQE